MKISKYTALSLAAAGSFIPDYCNYQPETNTYCEQVNYVDIPPDPPSPTGIEFENPQTITITSSLATGTASSTTTILAGSQYAIHKGY